MRHNQTRGLLTALAQNLLVAFDPPPEVAATRAARPPSARSCCSSRPPSFATLGPSCCVWPLRGRDRACSLASHEPSSPANPHRRRRDPAAGPQRPPAAPPVRPKRALGPVRGLKSPLPRRPRSRRPLPTTALRSWSARSARPRPRSGRPRGRSGLSVVEESSPPSGFLACTQDPRPRTSDRTPSDTGAALRDLDRRGHTRGGPCARPPVAPTIVRRGGRLSVTVAPAAGPRRPGRMPAGRPVSAPARRRCRPRR